MIKEGDLLSARTSGTLTYGGSLTTGDVAFVSFVEQKDVMVIHVIVGDDILRVRLNDRHDHEHLFEILARIEE